jgi:nitrite reductase (NADH) large subunit
MKVAMKIIIIGNGPAAVAAAESVRQRDSACEIVMVSKENEPFYSPCPLAEYIEGSVPRDRLFLRERNYYDSRQITTLFGRRVSGVDAMARQVRFEGGETAGYDRLLIATGAAAVMPRVPGLRSAKGVFTLKTLADADGILARAMGSRRAVVIGSGFIGLEAAQALARLGLRVTVVEALDQVLPRMLDGELADRVRRRLLDHGVNVLLGSPAEGVVEGSDGVAAVSAGGREIPCELVVCAAGVRADLSLLSGSGVAAERGVLVDDRMRTSQPDIYAAGDVIELNGEFFPNWPNAVATGRIAGCNMTAGDRRLARLANFNVVRIFDVPAASFGSLSGERILRWESEGVLRKVAITGGKVAGAQLWGKVDGTGLYHELMNKGADVTALARDLPSPWFGYGRMVRPARVATAALHYRGRV